MKILIILILLIGCKKEYSCEGCIEKPIIDTIPLPVDTTYNDLFTSCDISIADESKVRAIYPAVKTKIHPGHYRIFETIKMDGTGNYKRTYDLKGYHDMNQFFKGDTFYVFYEIRHRFEPPERVQHDTIIY